MRALRNLAAAITLGAGPAWAETVEIVALGDSLTQGYGLIQEDGFVPQLEAWLQQQGADVTVVNAGVSGDTTAGGLSRVDWAITSQTDAMIVALGGNDLLRGIDPEVSRANLDAILSYAEAEEVEVLLVGMQATPNYGPDYKTAFDAMYPDLSDAYGTLYVESFFSGLMQDGDIEAARTAYMQADGIHPNAEGVARIVEEMGPAVLDLVRAVGGCPEGCS